ncbi:hypothetical protein [Pseudorhodoferax soli]|uniref:GDSL-like lipase/acylhydrolase family protein n=1 Tax=Pseudorhodoferax soli TaxID=545864 RepID=A0A368XUE1_9BURK|nr:hypothetical protein [Pseudorhodoferax soli]RCW70157.1 hypothetical protein DES41_10595 [Pseudorhodoferax soli]
MATRRKSPSRKTTSAKPAPAKAAVAKKRAPPKKAAAPRPARPADGPLTLGQAKALVAARRAAPAHAPMRGVAPAGAPAGPAPTQPTPGDVGRERRQLAIAQRREERQRIQDYKAVMRLLKQRGVQGLPAPAAAPARAGAAPRETAGAGMPLQMLAEGDSWFDYPVPLFGGGIVPRLERLAGLPILNLAKAGDEARQMMGVEQRQRLTMQLRDGCPAGGAWDVLLFSGGGNDIVDDPMALWVRDFVAGRPPAEQLHRPRFDAALAMVRAAYEDLIGLRDTCSPGTQLVFHAYDFALPDGRGICHMGPWLKPTFSLRGFPTQQDGFEVMQVMLTEFAAMLASLAAANARVTLVNGQGTLAPERANWHNELHPSRQGFERFAEQFPAQLRALFPGRLPN